MNEAKVKMSWAETLNTVARGLDDEPQSVTGLAEKIGINRTKTRDALGVLEHDGIAIEMFEGWIHADKKNGRRSLAEINGRNERLLGATKKLVLATMNRYLVCEGESVVTFNDEMLDACAAYMKTVKES